MKKISVYRIVDRRFVRFIYLHSDATAPQIAMAVRGVMGVNPALTYFWEVADVVPPEGVPR